MLSVCIPIYNFDVREAVTELVRQLDLSNVNHEILLFDDCSNDFYRNLNEELDNYKNVYYELLPNNIGRSKIRNSLAKRAKFDYILFLDCDVVIANSAFIANYIASVSTGSSVICGGRVYPSLEKNKQKKLRWKYGIKQESKNANIRSQHPSKSFMTNNFLIRKRIFDAITFNENLSKYGHEDTLFGYELKQNDIIPMHIENPVLNGDIETDVDFLSKTKEGIKNLSDLYDSMKNETEFIEDVSLLSVYERIKGNVIFVNTLALFESVLYNLLKNGIASVFLFNLYKLSAFINCQKHE